MIKHGTLSCYTHNRCRKPQCVKAKSNYSKKRRKFYKDNPELIPKTSHGQTKYEHYSCRCDICKSAKIIANRKYRKRKNGV